MSAFVLTLVIGEPIKSLGIAVPKQTLYCYNKLLVRHLQVVVFIYIQGEQWLSCEKAVPIVHYTGIAPN